MTKLRQPVPHTHYKYAYVDAQELRPLADLETESMRVAWGAECAKVAAPARIAYDQLAHLADLSHFVRLFEDCLSFDDTGLTMQRRG